MKLKHNAHLAYCTNIHRGETWPETWETLRQYTLAVRDRIQPGRPYAIGLRLSDAAAHELSQPGTLTAFREWLERENAYVFTINGFPFGKFHGGRVKEQAYQPDWTTDERVAYTNRLFDLLVQLLPDGVEGSVSTVPCSFKEFIGADDQRAAMRTNLWRSVEHIARLSERTGRELHLGLEPEPLCFLETSEETVRWFEQLRQDRPKDPRLDRHLGVNYDACHLAVEFEEPAAAIRRLRSSGIKISKIHFSSALKVEPNAESVAALEAFIDPVYFHQVIARHPDGRLTRFRDLDVALKVWRQNRADGAAADADEWRIHFHIPLNAPDSPLWRTTSDHLLGLMDLVASDPQLCRHFEMETYTWEVLPPELKNRSVVDHLVGEYEWCLAALETRGLR